jgi:hypothetical protein
MMTVLEWPKDYSEPKGPDHPYLQRDTLNVYLITSRDGIHIDDEWIYAHRPLLPKEGKLQREWDSGVHFPSAQIISTDTEHRIYFEARPGSVHHEQRFECIAHLATASWPRDRLVGLRRAHGDGSAAGITTKPFRLKAGSLWLQLNCTSTCGQAVVEVLARDGTVWPGRSASEAVAISGVDGWVEVRWLPAMQLHELLAGPQHSVVPLDSIIRLKINLVGDTSLYAFELRPMHDAVPEEPAPTPLSPSLQPSPQPSPPPSSAAPPPSAASQPRSLPPSPLLSRSSPPLPSQTLPRTLRSPPAPGPPDKGLVDPPRGASSTSAATSPPPPFGVASDSLPLSQDGNPSPMSRPIDDRLTGVNACSLLGMRCSFLFALVCGAGAGMLTVLVAAKSPCLAKDRRVEAAQQSVRLRARSRTAASTEDWADAEVELGGVRPKAGTPSKSGSRARGADGVENKGRPGINAKKVRGKQQDRVGLLDAGVAVEISADDTAQSPAEADLAQAVASSKLGGVGQARGGAADTSSGKHLDLD